MSEINNNNNIAISVSNLHKSFKIPLENGNNLKQKIVNFATNKKGYREFSPLNGVSFDIKKGEFFGIVGRNGSGKSTLLKTVAGIYAPDSGRVVVNGTLVPFIELGVGFNPELTGRENVFLNGALLGFSRNEMELMYDEIVDFAELREFMDERLKNYSSGMQVRLAFSIAIRADGDILLLDEVLAVGDSAFQQKCYSYFNQLKKSNKTVVLVTHSMSAVERFCDRALLLDAGKVASIGSNHETAELYEDLFSQNKKTDSKVQSPKHNEKYNLADIQLDPIGNNSNNTVKFGGKIPLRVTVRAKTNIGDGNVGINIRDEKDQVVFSMDSRSKVGGFSVKSGETHSVSVEIDNLYTNGVYVVGVHVVDEDRPTDAVLFKERHLASYMSIGVTTHTHSLFHPPYEVRIDE